MDFMLKEIMDDEQISSDQDNIKQEAKSNDSEMGIDLIENEFQRPHSASENNHCEYTGIKLIELQKVNEEIK